MLIGQMEHPIVVPAVKPAAVRTVLGAGDDRPGRIVLVHKNGMIESYAVPPYAGEELQQRLEKDKHKFVQGIRRWAGEPDYGGFTLFNAPYVMVINL